MTAGCRFRNPSIGGKEFFDRGHVGVVSVLYRTYVRGMDWDQVSTDQLERQLLDVKANTRWAGLGTRENAGGSACAESCNQQHYSTETKERLFGFFHAPHFSTLRHG